MTTDEAPVPGQGSSAGGAGTGDTGTGDTGTGRVRSFDSSVAHCARVYNYWLGGKDNFAADREAAKRVMDIFPDIVYSVRANRAFLTRAVRFLATEAGIGQFLDIGTGIPTASNTHEVAQSVRPESRVVYVDNDPVVLAHARALLTSHPAGATTYIDADIRELDGVLADARTVLDFSQPVAVMLIAIMHLIGSADGPFQLVTRLMDAMPAGSYLALSHPAADITREAPAMAQVLNEMMAEHVTYRTQAEVARFFDGLELVDPGVVRVQAWRPGSELEANSPANHWAAVARKP